MKQGFSFVWMAGKHPYFIAPSGKIVELEVIDDIPYLRAGSKSCAPKRPTKRIRVPGVPVEAADVNVGGSGAADGVEAEPVIDGDPRADDDVAIEVPPEGGAEPVIDLDECYPQRSQGRSSVA